MHEVLVNRLGGLSLPRKSVVRLTDRPNMTLDVYRGRKTTMQQQQSNRVWHAALWATMRKYNISANLVRTTEQLYDKATSAVQMNGGIGEKFRTTVGVKQECLLPPTLLNTFLERIMPVALEEHDGKVSIGGRNIINLRFADDIDALAEEG